MYLALRWVFGLLGTVVLLLTPYMWRTSMILFGISVGLVCIWAFWLMMEYLRWARSMRDK